MPFKDTELCSLSRNAAKAACAQMPSNKTPRDHVTACAQNSGYMPTSLTKSKLPATDTRNRPLSQADPSSRAFLPDIP